MRWRWTEGGTATLAEDLSTWPNIVEIRKEEEWQRKGDWNMGEEKSRETTNNRVI